MSKEEITSLFRNGETEKPLKVSENSWDTLESMLDKDAKKSPHKSRFRLIGIAASAVLILGVAFSFLSHLSKNEVYAAGDPLEISTNNGEYLEQILQLHHTYGNIEENTRLEN